MRDTNTPRDPSECGEPTSPVASAVVAGGEPPEGSHRRDASLLSGSWPRISVDAAVIAAILTAFLYVSLSYFYNRFYETLHTRPEEVGLDRFALLARTFWLVFIASIALVFIVDAWDVVVSQRPSPSIRLRTLIRHKARTLPQLLMFAFIAAFISSLLIGDLAVDRRVREAQLGRAVAPISFGRIPIVDVSATPARVAWLDKDVQRDAILSDPWLLYLGQGDKVVVFIACGQTVITPVDKVAVITRSEVGRGDARMRKAYCDRVG